MGSHMTQPSICVTEVFAKRQIERGNQTLFPLRAPAWCLVFVGKPRAQALGLFPMCHVPLICKLREKAIHGFISHSNTSNMSDICSGVPSNTDLAKHEAWPAGALGSPFSSPGKSFCSQGTSKSLFAFLVCVPNTQCPPFSGTKENRRWHEVSTFSLMNRTAQPEIQVLNFQQQTKGSCSSPVYWNQVTFISASNPGSVCLLILLLSARLGVSSPCKQGKQIEYMRLWMKKKNHWDSYPTSYVFPSGSSPFPVPQIWGIRHFEYINRKSSLWKKI